MARRREQQKRGRERRILRAAARLLGTKAYAETAMEDVAASAGLAVGTHVECGRAAIALYGIYFTWFSVFLVSEGMTIERLREEIRRGTEIAMRRLLSSGEERGLAPRGRDVG